MKTTFYHRARLPQAGRAAFSLVEMSVSMGLYLGVFVGVMVAVLVFGLRVQTLAASKLIATADSRKALNALREQVRAAKTVYVGTYAQGAFLRITNGLPQTGNALAIYFNDANDVPGEVPVVYYQDASTIFRKQSNAVTLFANYVTNYYVFAAEDYQARIMTSYNNNPVIRITLQFHQWEYPVCMVGSNGVNAFNHYRLQARISRRSKD